MDNQGSKCSARVRREQEFHDQIFSADSVERQATDKYYRLTSAARGDYRARIQAGVLGKRGLEYGCGPGSEAFELASLGGKITGIDISAQALQFAEQARNRMGDEKSHLDFCLMNAEALEFEDSNFDFVCGSGILHHLNLTIAVPQIRRVLKPGGRAVFFEPLGHNPIINLYRKLTPKMRSKDEHPLLSSDLAYLQAAFSQCTINYYYLFEIAAAFAPPLRGLFATLDRLLFAPWMPQWIKRMGWICVIDLRK